MHQFENKIIKNTAQIDQHECLSSQREKQRGFMWFRQNHTLPYVLHVKQLWTGQYMSTYIQLNNKYKLLKMSSLFNSRGKV